MYEISEVLKEARETDERQTQMVITLKEKLRRAEEKKKRTAQRLKLLEAEEVIALLRNNEMSLEEGLAILNGERSGADAVSARKTGGRDPVGKPAPDREETENADE